MRRRVSFLSCMAFATEARRRTISLDDRYRPRKVESYTPIDSHAAARLSSFVYVRPSEKQQRGQMNDLASMLFSYSASLSDACLDQAMSKRSRRLCRTIAVSDARTAPSTMIDKPASGPSITSWLEEVKASALLMGTAVGGGFLAMPHSIAPAGWGPSTTVLASCWLVLLVEALLVADLIIDHATSTDGRIVSFATLGAEAFGNTGKSAISAAFLVLMMATIVSQISKGTTLLGMIALPPAIRCVILSFGLSYLARLLPSDALGSVNGFLTLGFVLASSCLFGNALPYAVWERLGRADWSTCLTSVPTLLQLHVYAEIVPVICRMLGNDRRRIRRSIIYGSSALFMVQFAWATLGMAVVPFDGIGLRIDPVEVLLSGGGVISLATAAIGFFAIATTILGTASTLHLFFEDAFRPPKVRTPTNVWSELAFFSCISLSTLIAAGTDVANAFFGAIDLAGAYPVAFLWGLAPPLMTLRRYLFRSREDQRKVLLSKHTIKLFSLIALFAGFMGANAVYDLSTLLGYHSLGARWQ